MRFRVPLGICAAAIILGASGAAADPTGRFTYVTPTAGFTLFDGDIQAPTTSLKDAPYWGARVGYQWKPWLAFEAAGGAASTHELAPGGNKISYRHGSANLVLTPWRGVIGNPFVSLGFGSASLSPKNSAVRFPAYQDKSGSLAQGGLDAACGWTAWVTDRWGIRMEGRDIVWFGKDKLTAAKTHTIASTVGLTYTFGS